MFMFRIGHEAKTSPLFLWHIFIDFIDKEVCAKFCSVLIRFHKVKIAKFWIQLKSRHTRKCAKYFFPFFVSFMEKNAPIKFIVLLIIFHELMKLRFEWLN